MTRHPHTLIPLALLLAGFYHTPARAQFAVIDVGAIAQLVIQLNTLRNHLQTAREQLTEAHNTYEAMTGPRGMEQLLGDVARNYLPTDWAALDAAISDTNSTFGELSADIQSLVTRNTILADEALDGLTPVQQEFIRDGRHNAAALAALARAALANTSARFESLQGLIDAIPTAEDPKAIADLQARIQSETTLLQNEQTKLQSLYQAEAAQTQLRAQRLHEQGIADTGSLRDLPPMGL
jgi:hypothetical protein